MALAGPPVKLYRGVRRVIAGLNGDRVADKSSSCPGVAWLKSNKGIAEHPEHATATKIDGKGTVRAKPSRVGVKQLVCLWPRRAGLRGNSMAI